MWGENGSAKMRAGDPVRGDEAARLYGLLYCENWLTRKRRVAIGVLGGFFGVLGGIYGIWALAGR